LAEKARRLKGQLAAPNYRPTGVRRASFSGTGEMHETSNHQTRIKQMRIKTLAGALLCAQVASLGLIPESAQARTLEEILKDKGVITAEDYVEASKDSQAAYTPFKGLTATSADGNSSFNIGGYAQLLYRYTGYEDSAKDAKSDFNTRRFKLVMKGTLLSKNVGYKFQGDASSGFRTEDAFIFYRFSTPLTLQAGQYKPPQSRQELTSAGQQLFPERSLANDTFNLGRDQGIQASGSFSNSLINYRIGLFNGNGPNTSNPNSEHMVTGRMDIDPLGAYTMDEAGRPGDKLLINIGASFAQQKVGPSDAGSGFSTDNDVMDVVLNLDSLSAAQFTAAFGDDLTWLLYTTNLNANWMGATFAGEYFNLNASPSLGSDWTSDGYYLQASYQMTPKLELAVRHSAIASTDTDAYARFDKNETQFGVNYYFAKHNLKLQSDATRVSDHLTANKDDTIFRAQAQFYY
jgi:phosphate-selective porin